MLRWPMLVLLLAAAFLGACSRQILTEPDLSLAKQPGLSLKPPLAISVIDDQAGERGGAFATKLAATIHEAYGGAVVVVPPGAPPTPGRVTVTLHVMRLGAFFDPGGAALVSARSVTGEMGDWTDVAKVAESAGPVSSGSRYLFLSGDWSGIADIDIAVSDLRPGRHAAFTLPLTAERVAPNGLGYLTAASSASDAWDAVRPRLVTFLNATVRKLAAEQ